MTLKEFLLIYFNRFGVNIDSDIEYLCYTKENDINWNLLKKINKEDIKNLIKNDISYFKSSAEIIELLLSSIKDYTKEKDQIIYHLELVQAYRMKLENLLERI